MLSIYLIGFDKLGFAEYVKSKTIRKSEINEDLVIMASI